MEMRRIIVAWGVAPKALTCQALVTDSTNIERPTRKGGVIGSIMSQRKYDLEERLLQFAVELIHIAEA